MKHNRLTKKLICLVFVVVLLSSIAMSYIGVDDYDNHLIITLKL